VGGERGRSRRPEAGRGAGARPWRVARGCQGYECTGRGRLGKGAQKKGEREVPRPVRRAKQAPSCLHIGAGAPSPRSGELMRHQCAMHMDCTVPLYDMCDHITRTVMPCICDKLKAEGEAAHKLHDPRRAVTRGPRGGICRASVSFGGEQGCTHGGMGRTSRSALPTARQA